MKALITTNPSASERLWAEHGLTGLTLFALFASIWFFVKLHNKEKERILAKEEKRDADNQRFLQKILDDSRDERKEVRAETRESYNKLTDAIDKLSDGLRQR